jgi:hypothetical protein
MAQPRTEQVASPSVLVSNKSSCSTAQIFFALSSIRCIRIVIVIAVTLEPVFVPQTTPRGGRDERRAISIDTDD